MNSTRKVITVLVLLILALGAVYFIFTAKPLASPSEERGSIFDVASTTLASGESKPVENKPLTLHDQAWLVFQNYIQAARAHDTVLVKNLSFQQSPTCSDPKLQQECFKLMDMVYEAGNKLKKENFKNIWSDAKQIILFTDPVATKTDSTRGYKKGFLFFTRELDGSIKMLALDPEQEWRVEKGETVTEAQAQDKLTVFMLDTDMDSRTDRMEICPDVIDVSCTKTDPKKRDTDGDGWWDGVELYFYKK